MVKLAAVAVAALLSFGAVQAHAVPFGPATGSIALLFSPTVTLANPSNTAVLNGNLALFSTSGSLFGTTTGSGSIAGTLSFATTVGATVPNPVANLLTFADTTGGTFTFSATSVTTQSLSTNPGVSNSVALYVLGAIGDTGLNLTPTPTSLTFTLNSTGGSAYSASATLANPPAPLPQQQVPEPMSLALLGFGLISLGLIRRNN